MLSISSRKMMQGEASFALLEYLANRPLRLAHPSTDQSRSLDRDEVHAAFGRGCLGQQGLAHAGRTIKQDALGGDARAPEQIRMHRGPFDRFLRGYALAASRPPTSLQRTSGTSMKTSRIAEGSTTPSASWNPPFARSAFDLVIRNRVALEINVGKDLRSRAMAASRQSEWRSAPT